MINSKVKEFLEIKGFGDRLTEHPETIDTVEHAAQQIGCTEAEIDPAVFLKVNREFTFFYLQKCIIKTTDKKCLAAEGQRSIYSDMQEVTE
jgi:hypothetical protein